MMSEENLVPHCKDRHLRKDMDGVDASVFSGDALHDADNRANFRWHLERWQRALQEFEDMAAANESEHA